MKKLLLEIIVNNLHLLVTALSLLIIIPSLLKTFGEVQLGRFLFFYSLFGFLSIGAGWVGNLLILTVGELKVENNYQELKEQIFISIAYSFLYGFFIFLLALVYGLLRGNSLIIAFGFWFWTSILIHSFSNVFFALNEQIKAKLFLTGATIFFVVFTPVVISFAPVIEVPILVWSVGNLLFTYYSVRSAKFFRLTDFLTIPLQWLEVLGKIKKLFLKKGKEVLLNGFILNLYLQDRIFLGLIADKIIVTNFSILWTFPNTGVLILWRISETFQPYFVKFATFKYFVKLKQYLIINLLIVLFCGSVGLIIWNLFGYKILKIWLGRNLPNFFIALQVELFISSLGILFLGIERVFASLLFALGELKILNILWLVASFIKYLTAYFIMNEYQEISTIIGGLFGSLFFILIATLIILRRLGK